MSSFLVDALIIMGVYVAAFALLFASYKRSGRVWVLRHCIVLPGPGRAKGRTWVSGYLGEAVILTLAAAVTLVILYFTPDVSLAAILRRWWWQSLLMTLFVAAVIHYYSWKIVDAATRAGRKPVYCRRLRAAYSTYNFYSVCLFGMGAMILFMLAGQFLHYSAAFSAEAERITTAFAEARQVANGPPAAGASLRDTYVEALAYAESGYGGIGLAGKMLQVQFNPLFIFAGLLIGINMLINFTPLKHMFMGEAVVMTAVFTYGPLVIIGLFALMAYLGPYEQMLESAIADLRAFTPPTGIGDWEIAQRHAEMVVEISNLRNIFGFGRIIGGEGGGFAIMAAGVQFALEKIAEKREEEAQPLLMPGPRYRPNAA